MQAIVDIYEVLLKDEAEIKQNIKKSTQLLFYNKFVYNIPVVKWYFIEQFNEVIRKALVMELYMLFPYMSIEVIMECMEDSNVSKLVKERYYSDFKDYL